MSYSLDDFCNDTRAILRDGDNPDAKENIRLKLEALLADEQFCATYVGVGNDSGLVQIFEDPDLHFCVLAYNMAESRTSPPHDHGDTWAVYGQAVGYTDMTIWAATDANGPNIEQTRTFRLQAGHAGLFDVREVHSIQYAAGAKFVRVTGADMSLQTRRIFDPEAGTVREIKHIASGSTQ